MPSITEHTSLFDQTQGVGKHAGSNHHHHPYDVVRHYLPETFLAMNAAPTLDLMYHQSQVAMAVSPSLLCLQRLPVNNPQPFKHRPTEQCAAVT